MNEAEEVAKLKERAATEKTALPDLHAMRNRPQLDEVQLENDFFYFFIFYLFVVKSR